MRLGYGSGWIDAMVLSAGSAMASKRWPALRPPARTMAPAAATGTTLPAWRERSSTTSADHRLNEIYPDKRLGQAALRAAKPGAFPLGARGSGRAVKQGWFFGCGATLRTGRRVPPDRRHQDRRGIRPGCPLFAIHPARDRPSIRDCGSKSAPATAIDAAVRVSPHCQICYIV